MSFAVSIDEGRFRIFRFRVARPHRAARQPVAAPLLVDAERHPEIFPRGAQRRRRARTLARSTTYLDRARLRAGVPRLLPLSDGGGRLVHAGDAGRRVSGREFHPLQPQPRPARFVRPPCLADSDRGQPRLCPRSRGATGTHVVRAGRPSREADRGRRLRQRRRRRDAALRPADPGHACRRGVAADRSADPPRTRASGRVPIHLATTPYFTPIAVRCRAGARFGQAGTTWRSDGRIGRSLSVTYWMNSLQHLPGRPPAFVSLNPFRRDSRFARPSSDALRTSDVHQRHLAAQKRLWSLQGVGNIWFCGAYFGFGFHEDGLQAGLAVAEEIGGAAAHGRVAGESDRLHLGGVRRDAAAELMTAP